jgi:hypothetical protein
VAPFDALASSPSSQQHADAAVSAEGLLRLLPQLVRERGKRLSADEAAQLVQVFFSPSLFSNRCA